MSPLLLLRLLLSGSLAPSFDFAPFYFDSYSWERFSEATTRITTTTTHSPLAVTRDRRSRAVCLFASSWCLSAAGHRNSSHWVIRQTTEGPQLKTPLAAQQQRQRQRLVFAFHLIFGLTFLVRVSLTHFSSFPSIFCPWLCAHVHTRTHTQTQTGTVTYASLACSHFLIVLLFLLWHYFFKTGLALSFFVLLWLPAQRSEEALEITIPSGLDRLVY